MQLFHAHMDSPVGALELVASDRGLACVRWRDEPAGRVRLPESMEEPEHPYLKQAAAEMRAYFAGQKQSFAVPLDWEPVAATPFQQRVWSLLQTIPYGETRSYGQLAAELGDTKLTRAVGAANGRNPLSIVVPCHRVVGQNGQLTGFAGGLGAKAFLLDLESARLRLFA